MRERRIIPRKERVDWPTTVMKYLTSKGFSWGCLSKNGQLFTMDILEHVKVPQHAIDALLSDGKISLNDSGYYKPVLNPIPRKPLTKRM